VGLAVFAGGEVLVLGSFLASVVTLARLVSVFSRLVRRFWRADSSFAGAAGEGVLFGIRDWTRGSAMRRFRMWALARVELSGWATLTGCMTLRYPRHRPSMLLRDSWVGGKALRSCSPGRGRKVGRGTD
jgi:hypothetical protein